MLADVQTLADIEGGGFMAANVTFFLSDISNMETPHLAAFYILKL